MGSGGSSCTPVVVASSAPTHARTYARMQAGTADIY